MENDPQTKLRPLLVGGFIALVVVLVWLAVQLVAVLPGAFNSLASIAESIQNYRPVNTLNMQTEQSIVGSGKDFVISWESPRRDGKLTFTYYCVDDVLIEIIDTETNLNTHLDCGEEFPVTSNPLTLRATTEEQRFVDFTYKLTYTPSGADIVTESNTITIVNAQIADKTTDKDNEIATSTPDTTTTDTVTATSEEVLYRTVEVPTYKIPVSDPNGYTELSIAYVGTGVVRNNFFHQVSPIRPSDIIAARFAVKNIGTKTSDEWTFSTELSSGFNYNSGDQLPLKPNEEAILTVVFPNRLLAGTYSFIAEVDTDRDRASTNNDLHQLIKVSY